LLRLRPILGKCPACRLLWKVRHHT
jgi:hypothetical protein